MDSWSDIQIKMMRQGGNQKLREFLSERGVPNNMRISAKYHTPDAEYYRKRHKALVEGTEVPAMPPRNPVDPGVDYSKGDPNGKERLTGESDGDYLSRQRRLNDAAKARMQAKFGGGGGRMAGCGSDPSYDPNAAAGVGGVADVVQGLGTLWGGLASKTREVAAAAQEDLARRQLGKKLGDAWQQGVDEDTRASLRDTGAAGWGAVAGLAKGVVGKVTTVVKDLAADDEWDSWGDEKPRRFPRSTSNGGGGGGGGNGLSDLGLGGGSGVAANECEGLPGEDRNGPGQLTGESEAQYVARQTRLREEAKERMRLKFGGGGGLSSASASSSSSSSSSSSFSASSSSGASSSSSSSSSSSASSLFGSATASSAGGRPPLSSPAAARPKAAASFASPAQPPPPPASSLGGRSHSSPKIGATAPPVPEQRRANSSTPPPTTTPKKKDVDLFADFGL